MSEQRKHWSGEFKLSTAWEAITGLEALVNLTPHALELRTWDMGMPAVLEVPSHGLARIEEVEMRLNDDVRGWDHGFGGDVMFPCHALGFGAVQGLPDGLHEVRFSELPDEKRSAINHKRREGGLKDLQGDEVWPVRFIVSLPTLMALGAQGVYRDDVWAPGRAIRDEKGVQVAAMGLRRLALPK